jgi:hypothetical protein
MDIIWQPVKEYSLAKIFKKPANCAAYTARKRSTAIPHQGARKALADLSTNTTIKAREDSHG